MHIFSQNHSKSLPSVSTRVLAVLFVVLYSLSAVRGFVPGMCATQSAQILRNTDTYTATQTLQNVPACCVKKFPEPKTTRGETPLPQSGCAFCTLAKARVEAPERYHFEVPQFLPETAPTFAPALPLTADAPSAIQDRAPPTA